MQLAQETHPKKTDHSKSNIEYGGGGFDGLDVYHGSTINRNNDSTAKSAK